uniref:ATP synthase F0 subunit 8 n=1 Tax=Tigriopus californicus TaxID=6832 RepID=A2T5A7_TIGCA|nr:ATP synthase F0 subunit 8 [Tigriopus californicus]
MPQMSPMNWYVLYLYFSFLFFLILSKIHFLYG